MARRSEANPSLSYEPLGSDETASPDSERSTPPYLRWAIDLSHVLADYDDQPPKSDTNGRAVIERRRICSYNGEDGHISATPQAPPRRTCMATSSSCTGGNSTLIHVENRTVTRQYPDSGSSSSGPALLAAASCRRKLTHSTLAKTFQERMHVTMLSSPSTQPGVPPNPYHSTRPYMPYLPTSTQESELQSMSSDANTESSVSGRAFKMSERNALRSARQNIDHERMIPRTKRCQPNDSAPRNMTDETFRADVIRALKKLRAELKLNRALRQADDDPNVSLRDVVQNFAADAASRRKGVSGTAAGRAPASTNDSKVLNDGSSVKNIASDDDDDPYDDYEDEQRGAADILDAHFSRLGWEDTPKQSPMRSPGFAGARRRSPPKFEEEDDIDKLFECIPDRWFLDESKSRCYWPPRTGKPFKLRAISCEKPDIVTWSVYKCKVVSEGHLTYSAGLKAVQEKCDQKYNTSSADEQINAALYRRKHPVLAMQDQGNIEHIFTKPSPTSKKETQHKQHKSVKVSPKKSKDSIAAQASSSSCSILDDHSSSPRLSSILNAGPSNDPHFEREELDKSDNDLNLDCGNKKSSVSVNGQAENTVIPEIISEITPKGDEVLLEDSASAIRSKQSRFSHPRSIETLSDRSHSGRSRSDRSRSSCSRSNGSRKNRSQLNRSSRSSSKRSHSSRSSSERSHSSRSSSIRSQSSRSRSNISRLSRSDSNKSRKRNSCSNESRQSRSPSKRSRSIESINSGSVYSITESRSPHNRKQQRNTSKTNPISSSGVKKPCRDNAYGPIEKLIKSNGNGIMSNTNKCSASGRPSNLSDSSRSRSKESYSSRPVSKSSRFRSKSRSGSPIRQKTNDRQQRQQLQADTRGIRGQKPILNKRLKADKSFVDGKNNRRRSLERNGNTSRYEAKSKLSRSSLRHRRSSSEYSHTRSRHSVSSFGSPQQSYKNSHKRPKNTTQSSREKGLRERSNKINSTADITVQGLMNVVEKMSETINENNQQLADNDRRLHRMEVTINKILVLVGDLSGNTGPIDDELLNDQGFEIPDLPITNANELAVMKRKLKNKEFRHFLIQHEKNFCCPTKRSTDTVTISKYLKRFISLRMRSKLTLKESGENGITLFTCF